jgi:hypothetical protein
MSIHVIWISAVNGHTLVECTQDILQVACTNKISQVSADSRSFMKLPLFQDHAVLWMKVAAQERKKEQVWPCSK